MRFPALAFALQNCYNNSMETTIDIQTLIASRLEDFANQVEYLYEQGRIEDAEFLREEGLRLAESYDEGTLFMYLPDYTQ